MSRWVLWRLARRLFRQERKRLPKEVQARLDRYDMERCIRLEHYAANWRRTWAAQEMTANRRGLWLLK